MTPRPERVASDHTRHDPILLASLAGGDELSAADRDRVDALLACPECQATYADLVALTASLRTDLPAPARPRDFRLTREAIGPDRAPWLRAWLGSRAGFRLAPVAAAICSIGLLMVLVGVALPGSGGVGILQTLGGATSGAASERNAASAPADVVAGQGATAGPSAVPAYSSDTPKNPQGTPRDGSLGTGSFPPGQGGLGPSPQPQPPADQAAGSPAGANVLLLGGAALVVAGLLGLFVARRRKASGAS